jgi:hypothetical protein
VVSSKANTTAGATNNPIEVTYRIVGNDLVTDIVARLSFFDPVSSPCEIKYTDVRGLAALSSIMMVPARVNPSDPSLQITAIIIVVVILAIGRYWYMRRRKGGAT